MFSTVHLGTAISVLAKSANKILMIKNVSMGVKKAKFDADFNPLNKCKMLTPRML
jgi:hypothetical protein